MLGSDEPHDLINEIKNQTNEIEKGLNEGETKLCKKCQRYLPIAILTADCVPILICDSKKKMIAVIHAGWKGAYKGIINKVIKFYIKKGSNLKNIFATIGPCINQKSYEVKKDFKYRFLKKDKKSRFFFKIRKGKTYFSLNKYIYYQLKKFGIKNLEIINKNLEGIWRRLLMKKKKLEIINQNLEEIWSL